MSVNQWKHGLCGCFDNCEICIITYFVPCYTAGKVCIIIIFHIYFPQSVSYIDRKALAKQGDNGIGSVRLSVCGSEFPTSPSATISEES